MAAQRLEFEKEKLKSETKLKEQEIDVQEKAHNDEMKLIKRYGDALAQVISLQPEEVTDLPAYFRGVEEQFKKLNVPRKYQARLIYKYLSARTRTLCSRDDYDYTRMKMAVLKENGLLLNVFSKGLILRESRSMTRLFCLLQSYVAYFCSISMHVR